jgi:hypothetical protein
VVSKGTTTSNYHVQSRNLQTLKFVHTVVTQFDHHVQSTDNPVPLGRPPPILISEAYPQIALPERRKRSSLYSFLGSSS